MAEMTFTINDQSTGGVTPVVQVTICENGDGTVTIRLTQVGGTMAYLGDLRGFFMDLAHEALLGSLSVTSSTMTLADGTFVTTTPLQSTWTSGDDSVSTAGTSSNNMNGLLGSDRGFDFGIAIGTEGVGAKGDDVRAFEFTLDSSSGDLSLADFANVNFGVRITSVGLDTNGDGIIDTTRNGSVKMLEQGAATTGPNATVYIDDDTFGGGADGPGDKDDAVATTGVLSHSYSSGKVVLTGAQFPCDLGLCVTTLTDTLIIITQNGVDVLEIEILDPATGAYRVRQIEPLDHGPDGGGNYENDILFTIGYDAISSDGDAASGVLTINVNDDSVHLVAATSDLEGSVTEGEVGVLAITGKVDFLAADGATAEIDSSQTVLTYAPGDGAPGLPAGLDADAIKDALLITDPDTGAWSFDASALYLDPLAEGDTITLTYKVVVTDGDGDSATQTVTITVNGTNDDPVALDDTGSGAEDSTITGSVATNDSDVDDGASLSYSLNGTAPAGFTLNPNGSWTLDASDPAYQHLAQGGTPATVTVGYTVSDGLGGTDVGELVITVNGTNDDPVALDDTGSGAEDSTITGSVATNDSDVDDGASLSYSLNGTAPAGFTLNPNGSWTLDASDPAYQHLAQGGTPATVTVGYTVSDGLGGTDVGELVITVNGTNDDPVALDDTGSGAEDSTITGSVATNDSDVDDGASLSYSLNGTAPAGFTLNPNGSWTLDASDPAYQHLAQGGTPATVTVGYTVSDGLGGTDVGELVITVNGTNDDPVALDDTGSGAEDSTITGSVATNDSDVDDGASLSYSLNGTAPAGFTLNPNGSWTLDASDPAYQHLAQGGTPATVTVGYTVSDGLGGTDVGELVITVNGTNDDPVALDDTGSGAEDSTITGSVATNDSDVDDGASLSYSLNGTAPAGFTLNPNGSWTLDASDPAYQHLAQGGTPATVTVGYTVSDGLGGTDVGELVITVNGTNDDPVALDDTGSGAEDSTITGSVATNDSDVDDGASLSYSLNGTAPAGFTLNPNGSWTLDASDPAYQHLAQGGTPATVTVGYTVSDGLGGTDVGELVITVNGTNDDPNIQLVTTDSAAATIAETNNGIAASGTVTVTDVDTNDTIGTTVTGVVTSGTTAGLVLTNAQLLAMMAVSPDSALAANTGDTHNLNWTFNSGSEAFNYLGAGQSLVLTYTIRSTDNNGASDMQNITVTINGSNDAATDLTFTYVGSPGNGLPSGAFGNITASDPDGGGVASFSITNISATVLTTGDTAPSSNPGSFVGDITISPAGVISASNMDDNRIYEVTVRVTQDGNTFDEVFSIITGTNADDTVSGAPATGDDVIFARGDGDFIFAGSGNDYLFGQQGNDQLDGGSGTDILDGAGGNDTLVGGAGNDTMTGGGNNDTFVLDDSAVTNPGAVNIDTITDYAAGEIIDVSGIISVSGSPNMASYVRVTTTGLVQVNVDGIGTDWVTLSNINLLAAGQQYTVRYLSNGSPETVVLSRVAPPIALDLDGDGAISFLATDAGAAFDYGGGTVATAWVDANDGILIRDGNHDGLISADEIVFATTGSDLEGLVRYDSNGDGQLSEADAGFADFGVWQDADSDGQVDAGELQSLAGHGIASISLSSDGVGYSAAGGDVQVVGTGSFTRTDGSTGVLADAVFATGGAVQIDPVDGLVASGVPGAQVAQMIETREGLGGHDAPALGTPNVVLDPLTPHLDPVELI